MLRKVLFAAALLAAALAALGAQEAPPRITLSDALASASASGGDFLAVAGSLDLAKRQRSLDLARQSLSIGASGSIAVAGGMGKDGESYEQGILGRAVGAASGGAVSSSYGGIASAPAAALSLSGPLTKLSLSASQTIPAPQPSVPTVAQSSVVGLSLTRTLWDGYPGGQYRASLEKSLLAYEGKELTAVQGGSAAVAKVKLAYIAMLAAQRDLEVKKRVFEKQSSLLAQIEAVYAIRQASAIDLRTAQVNARGAEIDVKGSDKALRLANERLAVLMGSDPSERFIVADLEDPAMPAASVDEAISIGLARRGDVAQLELSAKSSRIDAALARAQARPNVGLSGGAGLAIGWTDAPVVAQALSLGAKVAMPVYDSGAAELQAKASEEQAALYELQAAQLRKTLSSDIRDYFEGAGLQAEKVLLAKDGMDLAEAQFELVKAQNKFGTATVQDLLTASVTSATAEVGYGAAKSAYLGVVQQLTAAMGL